MHARFEHLLGVMHMATMLYRGIAERSRDILRSELGYNEDGLQRHEVLIRLAALFHDIGHSPFSHGAEELFPSISDNEPTERYRHEAYSAEIVRRHFADVIANHPTNTNYEFKAGERRGGSTLRGMTGSDDGGLREEACGMDCPIICQRSATLSGASR
jgi:HD superfamily phosphohydrolase